ncbi:hypothetical protein FACS189429_4580 [Bacteroidia bacterium]|nr:hypothetical protein FACS189429_4580 [Bacteroidia bacterium]GHV44560.1 hypothetical protein FACS1894180_6060 [Bacteroidia bacterium]
MFNFFKKTKDKDLIDLLESNLDLADLSIIPKLKEFISTSENEEKICKAYEFLGKIGQQNNIAELTNFLIERYTIEKVKNIKDSIHTAIYWQKKDETINLKPLTEIIYKYKKNSIVAPIISLLKSSTNPEAEDALIYIIKNDYDNWTKTQVNATLHSSGTRKCIPHLAKYLNHKDNDLAGSSFLALIKHSDKRESELFIEELENGKCKDSAMEGIVLHSGIEAVDAVIDRLKKKTSRQRKTDCTVYFFIGYENEVTIGLKFLNKHKNVRKDIVDFFDFMETKRKDKLFDYEFETLKKLQRTPYNEGTLQIKNMK